jgi:DNA-binding protein YbaB
MFDKLKQLAELKKMRDQVMQIQKALAEEQIEVEEGEIKVVITGDQKILEIEIEGEKKDRLVDVLNKAIKRSKEVAAGKLQAVSGDLTSFFKK